MYRILELVPHGPVSHSFLPWRFHRVGLSRGAGAAFHGSSSSEADCGGCRTATTFMYSSRLHDQQPWDLEHDATSLELQTGRLDDARSVPSSPSDVSHRWNNTTTAATRRLTGVGGGGKDGANAEASHSQNDDFVRVTLLPWKESQYQRDAMRRPLHFTVTCRREDVSVSSHWGLRSSSSSSSSSPSRATAHGT
uniref:Uncharacterized protein n=1 Tax=Rhizochromulina marina TaxID=1034831 RepID=A0A6U1ARW5_9STRA|mmetsp:Transcript_28069/g.82204  ORF Transcript_28069/g.82204 Transcript_28069/m.82204 type:complete len:194 (+) Transcript_28069:280-861(+)